MKIQTTNLLVVTALLSLFGCGGSSTTSQSAVLTKESARDAVKQAAGSLTSVQSANSGRTQRSQKTREQDETGGIKVGDPWYVGEDLWGRVTRIEFGFANGNQYQSALEIDMFSDEARTNKVGYQSNLLSYEDVTGINETDYHFTSGPKAPYRQRAKSKLNPSSGAMLFETLSVDKKENGEVYEQTIKLARNSWESRTEFELGFSVGGSRYLFVGAIEIDGSWESNWTNSQGYKINWRVNPDGTGSIRVENANNPLCPATGVYGTDGKGTLTYADGTTESFDVNNTNFWQQ